MDKNPELLQSEYWGAVKAANGWRPLFVPYRHGEFFLGDGLRGLYRATGPGGAAGIAYFGHAFPLSSRGETVPVGEVIDAVTDTLRGADLVLPPEHLFSRWDVPWAASRWDDRIAAGAGLRRTPIRVQPPDTVIVDLSTVPRDIPDDDAVPVEGEIFPPGMKKKTRYNVRLARKRGVTVRRGDLSELPRWYALYEETARRDRIAIHPRNYYETVFSVAREMTGDEAPRLTLYLAEHDGDLLAGIVVAEWRGRATYLYGASGEIKRNLMASYLLQWHAMVRAGSRGCTSYDLFGIPPADDPAHPMHGLYRFKTGFGGEIVNRPGCVDLNRRVAAAMLFHTAERGRQWYYHTFKKRGRR